MNLRRSVFFRGTMSFEAVSNSEIVKTFVVYGRPGRTAGKGGNSTQRRERGRVIGSERRREKETTRKAKQKRKRKTEKERE